MRRRATSAHGRRDGSAGFWTWVSTGGSARVGQTADEADVFRASGAHAFHRRGTAGSCHPQADLGPCGVRGRWRLSRRTDPGANRPGQGAHSCGQQVTRVQAADAIGLARTYLTTMVPAPPWRLLGTEFECGRGPVDLAWVHADGWVFYDEIKTGPAPVISVKWLTQVERYTSGGTKLHGAAFMGTRLIPLAGPAAPRLIARVGHPTRLIAPSPRAPFAEMGPRS